MISNLKIIATALAGLFGAAFYLFKKGEQSERNKSLKRAVKVVQAVKKRRSKRASHNISAVKQRLRKKARNR